jgi:hypothetical protein
VEAYALTPEEVRREVRRAAMAELWRRGEVWPLLEALLDRDQLADAQAIFADVDIQAGELPRDDYVLDISRQRGKSWLCCVLVAVLARCIPRLFVKYAAQELKSVRAIVKPTFDAILEDCPPAQQPTYDGQDNVWTWPNGSNVRAAGCNNKQYVALRGQKAHIVVKDESAFYDDYDAVNRVLAPQLQTTKGFTLDASTPPETPGHPYTTVAMAAKGRGRYSHRTIYNHPRMTPEEVEGFLTKEAAKKGLSLAAFKQSTYYKREFLCQHVLEEGRALAPEWLAQQEDGSTIAAACTVEVPRPEYFTAYSVTDPGSQDLFATLHGYWDFVNARLVVEDETILKDPSTDEAGQALLEAEARLWKEAREERRIDSTLRYSDIDYRLVKDLGKAPYNLPYVFTEKTDVEAARNNCRAMLGRGQILVHPRCKVLLLTLETAIWNERRTDIVRTAQTGHADAFMALVYWVRNLQKDRNPFPRVTLQRGQLVTSAPSSNTARNMKEAFAKVGVRALK